MSFKLQTLYVNAIGIDFQKLDDHLASGQNEKAIQDLKVYLSSRQGVYPIERKGEMILQAFEKLTGLLYQDGDFQACLEWTGKWIEFDQRNIRPLKLRAELLLKLGYIEGKDELKRLLKMFPDDTELNELNLKFLASSL